MCESKTCSAAEFLQKDIKTKEQIIQSVASALTQLNETRNWSYIDGIFRLLFGETTKTPPKPTSSTTRLLDPVSKNSPLKTKTPNKKIKKEKLTPMKQTLTPKKNTTPKRGLNCKLTIQVQDLDPQKKEQLLKDLSSSFEDVSFKDESISEIDGTPRAKSPVLENRKRRNQSVNANSLVSSNADSSDGVKRKGLETWQKSEAKQAKLTITTPSSSKPRTSTTSAKKKLVQSRFTSMFMKRDDVVDLTSSPEFSGGARGDSKGPVKSLIKAESSENEETILPSPTSNPTHEFTMFKSTKEKEIQSKFKRPLSLKHKNDLIADLKDDTIDLKNNLKEQINDSKVHPKDQKDPEDLETGRNDIDNDPVQGSIVVSYAPNKKSESKCEDLETSVNILNPNPKRFKSPKKSPPKPIQTDVEPHTDYDVTHCDSLNNIEEVKENCSQEANLSVVMAVNSPTKRPLGENNNVSNVPHEADSSMSLLTRGAGAGELKRKTPEKVEPVYKEPTVRKKAEKMALPAWLCDQCKKFTDALYDDPDGGEKAKAIIQACGKHRGRQNPVRPKTPPGFWDVRWNVPEDTEEFNRRNNAA